MLHAAVAAIVTATATVSMPAHAEAQFWEEIFRANRARRAAAPPPPQARVQKPKRTVAAVGRPAPGETAAIAAPATVGGPAAGATAAIASTSIPSEPKADTAPAVGEEKPKAAAKAQPAVMADPRANAPLLAVVSIEEQHISLYGSAGLIEVSNISSGTASNPTPTGLFGVSQKARWHESNLYSGAAMPYMQRLTWGGIALHEGRLPGYAASHGCIRLPRAFAARLFGLTRTGFRVVIAEQDLKPEPVFHARLPQPLYRPAPAMVQLPRLVRTAGLETPGLDAAPAASGAVGNPAAGLAPGLNPIAYAEVERAVARAELKPAEQAEAAAETALAAAARVAKSAATALKTAERRYVAAQDALKDLGLSGPLNEKAKLDPSFPQALIDFERIGRDLEAAREADASAQADLANARAREAAASQAVKALQSRISEMGRRLESVSILVSRKDRRVYVRQALKPVFDLPVEIRDEDLPVGNHTYVAMPPAAGETALRWMAITLPLEERASKPRKASAGEVQAVVRAIPLETATSVLDRIQLPAEAVTRISELVWVGSSLIVTDHGPGHDGAPGHDFAVETRH